MQPSCDEQVTAGAPAGALSDCRRLRTESCQRRHNGHSPSNGRLITAALAALLLLGPAARSLPASQTDPTILFPHLPRIRTADAVVADAVQRGQQLSATFRQLVSTLQRSNVIVYLERTNRLRDDVAGQLRLAGAAGGLSYVHVSLSTSLTDRELIMYIAHELAHAVEIASAGPIIDARGMSELYCRIGFIGPYGFDSEIAQRVTEQVSGELDPPSFRDR